MFLTDQIAPTKLCPFSRANCVGSGCPGWRWNDPSMPVTRAREARIAGYSEEEAKAATRPSDVPETWKLVKEDDGLWLWEESVADYETRLAKKEADYAANGRRGYCGAFGKPEEVE